MPAALSYDSTHDQDGVPIPIGRTIQRQTRWLTGYFTLVAAVWLTLWELLPG